MTPEQIAERRREMSAMATADAMRIQSLTTEIATARTFAKPPSANNADDIRRLVFAAAASMGVTELPRGYRVLGGTPSTPHYLMHGKTKPSDAELIADAATGWLAEIADRQQQTLERLRPQSINGKPLLVITAKGND